MLEFTEKGIPLTLRPAFQEYVLEALDPDQDWFTVMGRTLAHGKREELAWLFDHYGRDRLVAWLQGPGWRTLSRRRIVFWITYFNLQDIPRRKGAWPH